MSTAKQLILVVLILGIGIGVAALAKVFKPEPKKTTPTKQLLTVEIATAQSSPQTITLQSEGLLQSSRQSALTSEITGKIIRTHPNFRIGATFNKGDILLEIDNADYLAAQAQAQAEVADAELALAQENAKAQQAQRDWKQMGGQEKASPLVLRIPQLKSAKARLTAKEAALRKAGHDLERTKIRAPYSGTLGSTHTELGSQVLPGSALADYFDHQKLEIQLPISLQESSLLPKNITEITLTDPQQPTQSWKATYQRQLGTIDRKTRSLTLIASLTSTEDNPLQPGLYLNASIPGQTLPDLIRIPRHALQGKQQLYLLNDKNELHRRDITIAHQDDTHLYVQQGLKPGERYCLTSLDLFVDGMEVAPVTK